MSIKCSVIKEIQKAEDVIKTCYERVKILEEKLKTKELPAEQRHTIENELKEAKKLLDTNKEQLSSLHGENRRSFAISAALFFVCFLLYGLYLLFGDKEL